MFLAQKHYLDTLDHIWQNDSASWYWNNPHNPLSVRWTGAAPENVERRCWGGARQLIVNMTKTGCYYYYFYMNNKNHYIGAFQMFMRNVGVLSRLAYCMGARTQLFLFIYSCGKSLLLRGWQDVRHADPYARLHCKTWSKTQAGSDSSKQV